MTKKTWGSVIIFVPFENYDLTSESIVSAFDEAKTTDVLRKAYEQICACDDDYDDIEYKIGTTIVVRYSRNDDDTEKYEISSCEDYEETRDLLERIVMSSFWSPI